MEHREIPIDHIDSSPFQTRKEFDIEALTGLATSAVDELGIRHPPIVRPSPEKEGRYQIASGHARIEAWKTLGHKTIMCRIEKLTDSQMKKEILVENVNRTDLNEEERFQAIEQYRQDLGLEKNEYGFASKLSKVTGVAESLLSFIYDVQQIRQILSAQDFNEKPSARLINKTRGLPDEERVRLVVKAVSMGWSADTAFKVKTAIKDMEPEVRALILEEKSRLPQKVIVTIAELENPETQLAVIDYIQTHRLDEELALKFIERAKEGPLVTEAKVVNEAGEVLDEIREVYATVKGWGINQYKVVGPQWDEAVKLFRKIKGHLTQLMAMHYEEKT